MDFVRIHFGKMQLWIVELVFLHKKVPVVMNHNIRFFKCYDSLVQVPFCEEKRVQLLRVACFQSDYFQNPYSNSKKLILLCIIQSFEILQIFWNLFWTLEDWNSKLPKKQIWSNENNEIQWLLPYVSAGKVDKGM